MMDPDDRADLIFDVAEVMNEYYDEGYSADEVRSVVVGQARGWRDDE